ncbi:hypothetical protein [Shewanella ulleungensis]|jgi:hypothetical protein|uniref:hypothetical protein n=1 Tax=Shewanella ulleungensis TaxID=2282699 RepID=UPI003D7B1BD6
MRISLVLMSLFMFMGCASTPHSATELRTAGKAKTSFCSEKAFKETVAIIEAQLQKCFAHGEQEVFGGTSNTFIEMSGVNSKIVTISSVAQVNWNRFYQAVVDITAQDQCPALVEAYGMSDSWSSTTHLVQDWVAGNNLEKCS